MSSQKPLTLAMEKPQNGVRGLKHWRYDLLAGLQVALVGLPLSLGIAVASGAPPITGVISAIIAGFVFPFLGEIQSLFDIGLDDSARHRAMPAVIIKRA